MFGNIANIVFKYVSASLFSVVTLSNKVEIIIKYTVFVESKITKRLQSWLSIGGVLLYDVFHDRHQ